jgi:hypothetical protein
MKFTWRTTTPQVRVLPYLTVAVKCRTWTLTVGQWAFTARWQAEPVIPEAFREDAKLATTAHYRESL